MFSQKYNTFYHIAIYSNFQFLSSFILNKLQATSNLEFRVNLGNFRKRISKCLYNTLRAECISS